MLFFVIPAFSFVIPAKAGTQTEGCRGKKPLRLHARERPERNAIHRRDQQFGCPYCAAQGGDVEGFAKKYGVNRLVWCEPHETMESAIIREKQMKKWNRAWKIRQILRGNPEWRDLTEEVC